MKALVVYISTHHGNTEQLAEAVAETLQAELVDLKATGPDSVELADYDLVGFGSGIYWGSQHKSLLEFIEALPEVGTKKAFVFSTSGMWKLPLINTYHSRTKQKLAEKGFDFAGEFSCRGYDTFSVLEYIGGMWKNRPNQQDLNQAREFAESLKR